MRMSFLSVLLGTFWISAQLSYKNMLVILGMRRVLVLSKNGFVDFVAQCFRQLTLDL